MSEEIRNNRKNQPAYDPDFDEPFQGDGDAAGSGSSTSAGSGSSASAGRRIPPGFSDRTPDVEDLDSFSGDGPDLDDLEDLDGITDLNAEPGFEDLDAEPAGNGSSSGNRGGSFTGTGSREPGKLRELNTVDTTVDARQLKDEKAKKKKSKIKKIIGWIVLEVFTLAAIFTYGYFLRSWNLISRPEVNEEKIENNNISLEKKQEMEQGYWTVAVFGVDGRSASDLVSKGLNSDVILIVNINQATGEIRMCNVFRDTYLNISDKDSYRKINAAYCNGGPEQALAALNKNLDLNIKNYVTFNWKAVADGINILGGVDGIDISKAEFYYINAFITETVEVTGIGSHHLKAPGTQHLDGVQAVAYGRLRLMDSDFARTERQKKIIKACFEKAKHAGFSVLNNIMVVCFPEVATNIDFNTVVAMAQNIDKYDITASGGFPWQRSGSAVSSTGDVVVPATLESNVRYLHMFLFDDENYQPSNAVLRYSETIKEKTGIYKEGQVVEYVRTDGGLVSKPKATEAETKESSGEGVSIHETDENGSELEFVMFTIGIDENGNYVYPTDENGITVLPTDPSGNIQYPTDEYGNIIYETDAEGNTVNPTDAEGNTLTYPASRPAGTEAGGAGNPGETSHGDDRSNATGPGSQSQTGGNTQHRTDGPTGTTASEAYGPGNTQSQTAESSTQSGTHPSETINGGSTPGSSTGGNTGGNAPGSSTTETASSGSITPGGTGGPGSSEGGGSGTGSPGGSGSGSSSGNAPGSSSGSGTGNAPGSTGNTTGGAADGPGGSGSATSGGSSPGSAPG